MPTCRTCGQPLPGMPEPLGVNAVVECSCGCSWVRRPGNPGAAKRVGQWVNLTRARDGRGGSRRHGWLLILSRHAGDGHELRVAYAGSEPGTGDAQ